MSSKFNSKNPDLEFLEESATDAAPWPRGCELVREIDAPRIARVKIVETEAYDQTDVASHSYRRSTAMIFNRASCGLFHGLRWR